MAKILNNKDHYNLLLKVCLAGGDSITKSSEVNDEPKEKEDKPVKQSKK